MSEFRVEASPKLVVMLKPEAKSLTSPFNVESMLSAIASSGRVP